MPSIQLQVKDVRIVRTGTETHSQGVLLITGKALISFVHLKRNLS